MEKKVETVPSNEEIIDELTKDLEKSCVKDDATTCNSDNLCNSNTRSTGSGDEPWDGEEKEKDDSRSTNVDTTDLPSDYVDEDLLKDRELNLSDAEKQDLKNKAEELKNKGNACFKDGKYEEAILLYTEGLQTCSLAYNKERAILYANRAAAKRTFMSDKELAIADCTKAIELNPNYVKALVRRAQLYEDSDKLDEALQDFKTVLTFDSAHSEANYAIRRLPPLIEERNEKLKAEMFGKLKDIGNMMLKPFGLSTNNFELQKDSSSGSYSVQFKQTPR